MDQLVFVMFVEVLRENEVSHKSAG